MTGSTVDRYNDIVITQNKSEAALNQLRGPIIPGKKNTYIALSSEKAYIKGKDLFRTCCLSKFSLKITSSQCAT